MRQIEKGYGNAREAHKDGLVWTNVSLNAGPGHAIGTLKIQGAVCEKAAKAISMIMFGESVEDIVAHLQAPVPPAGDA